MKKKVSLLIFCLFSSLIVYCQDDSQNQNEAERKDFCEILGEVCSKTSFKERRGGTTTYYFDQEKLIQRKQTNLEAIVNLYKEEMLSPQDSFVLGNTPKKRLFGTEYGFTHYYKGLRVYNSTSILVTDENVPYSFTTTVKPLDLDTIGQITIEQAVDIVRDEYGEYLSVPLSISIDSVNNSFKFKQPEYPKKDKVTKFIYRNNDNQYCVVYRFLLRNPDLSDYTLRQYSVNIANGKIETISDSSSR